MAREKKSMIGVDPLAWLDKEKESVSSETETANQKVEGASTKVKKQTKVKHVIVFGHKLDEVSLIKGYDLSLDNMIEVVNVFYNDLFESHPETSALFEDSDKSSQSAKLTDAIKLLVENLHNEDALRSALSQLGVRHQKYGVKPEFYPIVVEILVASFKKVIGRHWTKAVSKAWVELLTAASEIMCSAYETEDGMQETENIDAQTSDPEVDGIATLHLHGVQDISKSQALKNEMLAMVNDHDQINIDASDVERIDGTALQLLCSLFAYAKEHNLIITWLNPSEQLLDSAKISGVETILELG